MQTSHVERLRSISLMKLFLDLTLTDRKCQPYGQERAYKKVAVVKCYRYKYKTFRKVATRASSGKHKLIQIN